MRGWDAVSGATSTKPPHYLSVATDNDEYNTPAPYIDMAQQVLGPIHTDPATNAEAQKLIQAKRIYTPENSGLGRPWFNTVWLNSPHSHIEHFVRQLVTEYFESRAKAAIMLTHNATETAWYREAMTECAAFCLPKGRIQYTDRQPIRANTFFYFGQDVEKFADVFSEIGPVVRVIRQMKMDDTQGPDATKE